MQRFPRSWTAPYPLTFEAVYQPRVWGGRRLERLFGRHLPHGPIGESWELSDRSGAESVVDQGRLAGMTLGELWEEFPDWFPYPGRTRPPRFPLLVKVLDCHDRLSVQVHPGAPAARRLGGEPKAELWYFLHPSVAPMVHAGFRRGTTRERFLEALQRGGPALVELLHVLKPGPGDVLLVPPGRIHALGAGNLLCEIQQNSDTTYRVYDWDRVTHGRSRPLHVQEALEALDFDDWEPDLLPRNEPGLVRGPWFHVSRHRLNGSSRIRAMPGFVAGQVVEGTLLLDQVPVSPGRCFLLPRGLEVAARPADGFVRFLQISLE